eukprot:Anaeramoba_ignava/a347516_4.p1 GENE.a347516_4~~a347516_4.p1  ORF type:complete len:123 (-),score=9.11 a347516_4:115-483(-)
MKLLNILFILQLFFIHSFALELSLSKEQKEYLKNKKSLNLCTDKDFMPFSRFENGRYEGIGSDIYKIIQKRTDLDINIIPLSKAELKEPKTTKTRKKEPRPHRKLERTNKEYQQKKTKGRKS